MVSLRALQSSDNTQLVKLLSDPDVTKYTGVIPYPYSIEDADYFINLKKSPDINNDAHYGVIYEEMLVGVIGITRFSDIESNNAEIGYWCGKDYWRKGIMCEAVSLLIADVIKHSNIRKITASVFEVNKGSQKVLLKNGFNQVAVLKDHYVSKGIIYNAVYFERIIPR